MKLCLYGAGNTGKHFIENRINNYKESYMKIFFADSAPELLNFSLNGYIVKSIELIDENTEVIITSIYWHEIYKSCCLNGFKVIGIYDIKTGEVYTYKEMCRLNRCTFENEANIRYCDEKRKKEYIGIEKFTQSGKLFENINEVALMLSNLCNYAYIHKKCPASCVMDKDILPSEIVFKVIDELSLANFDGTICFHIYNEPLIDPRLFWFIDYIKKKICFSKVKIYSNGYYLNGQMVKELKDVGVDILQVTGYGDAEYNRMLDLQVDMAYSVLFGNLDNRLDMYEDRKDAISNYPCNTYFTQVSIYSNGDIGTCCLDYKHSYKLGNICTQTLKEILNSECIVEMQKKLSSGNRMLFPICKNCDWRR